VCGPAGALVAQAGVCVAVDGRLVEQRRRDEVEALAVPAQGLGGPVLLLAQDPLDLLVDDA
jgi:hypothetical protein